MFSFMMCKQLKWTIHEWIIQDPKNGQGTFLSAEKQAGCILGRREMSRMLYLPKIPRGNTTLMGESEKFSQD